MNLKIPTEPIGSIPRPLSLIEQIAGTALAEKALGRVGQRRWPAGAPL